MKQINLSGWWKFSEAPFPAYRSEFPMGFTQTKRTSKEFLAVSPNLKLTAENSDLPEGHFRVLTTRKKQTKFVVPDEYTSDNCLLFIGERSGFNGGVRLEETSTAEVINKTIAFNGDDVKLLNIIAILEKGQQVDFYVWERRGLPKSTGKIVSYLWTGEEIVKINK